MPLMVRWPAVIGSGREIDALVQNIDYAPTLLEMAGAAPLAKAQGASFAGLLRGTPPSDWRDSIYYAYYANKVVHNVPRHDGVRTDRYKLMWFPLTSEWQLFDLVEDPDEMASVHNDPQYASVLSEMQQRYNQLREEYAVPPTAN